MKPEETGEADRGDRRAAGVAPAPPPGPARGRCECARLSAQVVELGRRLDTLEGEREFLLAHAGNLERELRRLRLRGSRGGPGPGRGEDWRGDSRLAQLEASLTEARANYHAVITSRAWRALAPYRAVRRALRRLGVRRGGGR